MINSIGNCMLLRSTTNIGRGKTPFKEFFPYLWDNENEKARLSLGISDAMGMPNTKVIEIIRNDIQKRASGIRTEIKNFIAGKLSVV